MILRCTETMLLAIQNDYGRGRKIVHFRKTIDIAQQEYWQMTHALADESQSPELFELLSEMLPTFERMCQVCGGPITSKHGSRLYCSRACKQKAYRRNKFSEVIDGQ